MNPALLEVRGLRTRFKTRRGCAPAVDGVSFSLHRGETLALVGESGSGKSVTAASILRLVASPGEIVEGEIRLEGRNLLALSETEMQRVRGGRIALVPQDALAALNPVQSIGTQIVEVLQLHWPAGRRFDRRAAWDRAVELLSLVQIPSPELRAHDPPHRLSGGMRQRALIAMALAGEPALLIADEPTTALDVTTQAQVLTLLAGLQQRLGLSILLITHDLGVVAESADRAAVMYAGRVVEEGAVHQLLSAPAHPYTQGLLDSLALHELAPGSRLPAIVGQVPSLFDLPKGCAFAPRCGQAGPSCRREAPAMATHGAGHRVACWHPLQRPQTRKAS